ncbi:amino acid--tRNA ligase-related protein, partial [Leucobacter sp. OLJS4]
MTERVLIKDLAAREDGPVRVSGWVEKVRDQRYVQFVVLRDESGAVQLVNGGVLREPDPENPRSDILVPRTTTISELTQGTFVTVEGELQHNERVKLGGVEIQIETIEVVTAALPDNPIAADSGIDVRLDWRFLDLRRPEQNLVFRIQTTFLHALRNVWVDRGFIEIQTPKLMASASESRAELFEVEYFEGKAFLAQSPQFFKQMAQAAGFGGIFEVGPAFRADHSFTSRHATEFTSIDTELSWIDSHEDVMELHEELIVAGLS